MINGISLTGVHVCGTYKYLVISSISISIESCRMLKSSRSIKYFTSTSFNVSMNEWNSLMMIWSWAMFMLVSICLDSRRFDGATFIPTLFNVLCTRSVIGHMPCFWRSIWKWISMHKKNRSDYKCFCSIYLHLHVCHVLCLCQSHSCFDLKARLMRKKVVVVWICWWSECQWCRSFS